jgi:protocatechuate 3,4-dioxygenase beta subunit
LAERHYSPRDWATHPPYRHDPYVSTRLRGPTRPLVPLNHTLSEITGPIYGQGDIDPLDNDLTRNAARSGVALGERIIVSGRVLDDCGAPIPNTLIEIWQANAAGRYIHKVDQHDAPLDPNFLGAGRCVTDHGGRYSLTTIKPGAYPWPNHPNAWRPPHIHFSIFGPCIATRLVTQMYFPGDPLLKHDPIFNSVPDEKARNRLIAKFSLDLTQPDRALGYEFNIVLRGRNETPME